MICNWNARAVLAVIFARLRARRGRLHAGNGCRLPMVAGNPRDVVRFPRL